MNAVLLVQAFDAITECRGRSVNAVGRRAGVSPATLSRLRTGHRSASPAVVAAISAALEVDPAAIFPQLAGWTPPVVTK